jgi:hypothetical protein
MSMKLLGIISLVSVVTDLLWIRFSTFGYESRIKHREDKVYDFVSSSELRTEPEYKGN